MFARFALATTLGAASLLPLAARADSLAPCELLKGIVAAVQPHKAEQHFGKNTVSRLDGASVFVRAKPGLSAEWLQRSLGEHLTKMTNVSMADCPLDAKGLRVDVRSGGDGYWVTIRAKDQSQAKLVLERAQSLLHHSG
jgi:hypothetical protein